jgi:acyl carrier protein
MTRDEAYAMIKQALENTSQGMSAKVSEDIHLVEAGVLDSLESMNFIFELEQLNGARIDAIDETFDDFRVSRLMDILVAG